MSKRNSNNNNKSPSPPTVRLNVGGHLYEVPRSLFDLYPESMLARLLDDTWRSGNDDDSSNETIFVDRNGERFQYVLDLLRDGRVFLPLTVSKEAFLVDLEYFGLLEPAQQEDDVSSPQQQQPKAKVGAALPKFDIHQGGLAEINSLVQTVEGNVDADLQSLDEQIQKHNGAAEECEQQKNAIQTAHTIFKRSCCAAISWTKTPSSNNNREKWERTTVQFENNEKHGSLAHDAFRKAGKSLQVQDFLKVRLEAYGLTLVEASGDTYKQCEFVVERRCNSGGGESKEAEEEARAPSPPPAKKQRRGAK